MKILVPIKRVVDYNVKVRPNADGSDVDIANAKMSMNPFCEIAVEEAVRVKEAGHAEEIVVVTIGPAKAQEQLRAAMALGADRAIHITTDEHPEPLAVAKCLQAVMQKEPYDLVILGKQSIDGDNNQTAQMLAALTQLPQGTFASKLVVQEGKVEVTREIDGGLQVLELDLPAIVSTDLRLNEPRYSSLPNIMKAKKKPLEALTPEDLQVDISPRTETLSVSSPQERSGGVKVANVDELIEKLRNEAKVIS